MIPGFDGQYGFNKRQDVQPATEEWEPPTGKWPHDHFEGDDFGGPPPSRGIPDGPPDSRSAADRGGRFGRDDPADNRRAPAHGGGNGWDEAPDNRRAPAHGGGTAWEEPPDNRRAPAHGGGAAWEEPPDNRRAPAHAGGNGWDEPPDNRNALDRGGRTLWDELPSRGPLTASNRSDPEGGGWDNAPDSRGAPGRGSRDEWDAATRSGHQGPGDGDFRKRVPLGDDGWEVPQKDLPPSKDIGYGKNPYALDPDLGLPHAAKPRLSAYSKEAPASDDWDRGKENVMQRGWDTMPDTGADARRGRPRDADFVERPSRTPAAARWEMEDDPGGFGVGGTRGPQEHARAYRDSGPHFPEGAVKRLVGTTLSPKPIRVAQHADLDEDDSPYDTSL